MIYNIYCPHCGSKLERVATGDEMWEKGKPKGFRCTGCGQGWEVLQYCNDRLLLSGATKYDRPTLKVVNNG